LICDQVETQEMEEGEPKIVEDGRPVSMRDPNTGKWKRRSKKSEKEAVKVVRRERGGLYITSGSNLVIASLARAVGEGGDDNRGGADEGGGEMHSFFSAKGSEVGTKRLLRRAKQARRQSVVFRKATGTARAGVWKAKPAEKERERSWEREGKGWAGRAANTLPGECCPIEVEQEVPIEVVQAPERAGGVMTVAGRTDWVLEDAGPKPQKRGYSARRKREEIVAAAMAAPKRRKYDIVSRMQKARSKREQTQRLPVDRMLSTSAVKEGVTGVKDKRSMQVDEESEGEQYSWEETKEPDPNAYIPQQEEDDHPVEGAALPDVRDLEAAVKGNLHTSWLVASSGED
jgi:hypothetical protein